MPVGERPPFECFLDFGAGGHVRPVIFLARHDRGEEGPHFFDVANVGAGFINRAQVAAEVLAHAVAAVEPRQLRNVLDHPTTQTTTIAMKRHASANALD